MRNAMFYATVLLVATTLVLPGRQTPAIIDKGGTAGSKLIKAATGQK